MSNSAVHKQFSTIDNIRFSPDCLTNLLGIRQNNGTEDKKENISVCESQLKSCRECESVIRDTVYTSDLWNQKVFYILKDWTCIENQHRAEKFISIGRTPHEYSIKEYFDKNIEKLNGNESEDMNEHAKSENEKQKQEEFHSFLQDIMDLVRFLHMQKIVLNNISLDNIRICKDYDNLKAKIVNLSDAEASFEERSDKYTVDINKIGQLFLSIITHEEKFDKVLRKINDQLNYKDMFGFVSRKIENFRWIEPYRKKLLAHLIIYLIKAKDCDHVTIQQFIKHPFFWDFTDIEDFLRIINCRIDANDKEKDRKLTEKRIKQLNDAVKYENWKDDINECLHVFVQQPYDKKICKCNDLVKFIRNKIAHKDDDTDNEDISGEDSSNQGSSSKSPNPKKKKSDKDLTKLCKFFDDHGGPLNYFLLKFPDLLYDLYIFFQRYSRHKKIKPFYSKCFIEEKPVGPTQNPNFIFHPAPDRRRKNRSIKNAEEKEKIMKDSIKKKS